MTWDLPIDVNINGQKYKIRNNCDYRIVLDTISALNDPELDMDARAKCALFIFYEDLTGCKDFQLAITEMIKIINYGEEKEEKEESETSPKLMDWEYDFPQIAPPISRVLGYSVRNIKNYTHWYDFLGAYMEIGECTFSNIISLRKKKIKGKKLESWEIEFYKENKNLVDLPIVLTEMQRQYLDELD